MSQEFCTQCPKQCPKDQLSCGKGRAFFGLGVEEKGYGRDLENVSAEEMLLSQLLNRCGYIASKKGGRQNVDWNSDDKRSIKEEMFQVLQDEEREALRNILEKLLNQWMSERRR